MEEYAWEEQDTRQVTDLQPWCVLEPGRTKASIRYADFVMRIVVMVGLPGSGKSTYLERLGVRGLSSDGIRKLLADDETDQTIHVRVFQTLRYLLGQRLGIGRPVTYIDATNLTPAERRPYVAMGRTWGCEVEAVFFDVPLGVCLERNELRQRVVPGEALAKMALKLVPPTTEEGFARVTVVGEL